MERTIRVTGKGKLSVKPDTIRLRINMEGIYPEYAVTLQKSSEKKGKKKCEMARDSQCREWEIGKRENTIFCMDLKNQVYS